MQILKRLLLTAVAAGGLLALGLLILIPQARAFTGHWSTAKGESLQDMSELSERSIVERRDGSQIAVLFYDENRAPVKLSEVPEAVIKAVVGIEDDRFWEHHGVDLRGTFRALATNVSSGDVRQGGSTITQQLVKNSILTPEKTVDRKVREAFLAWRLEDHTSKNEILERYLNTVYFGNGAYGVQAAAETYFGKKAKQLNMAEAAMLAGTIRNPVGYDPIRFPDRAKARRKVVVDRLVAQHVMSAEAGERVLATPLPTVVNHHETEQKNDYFVEQVKQTLLDDTRLGDTQQERNNAVFKGGLRIVTTLDPDVSDAAQNAVDDILPDTDGKFTAALASIEPSTGAVRAIVGGKDFESQQFNLATQSHRQPGSAFKAMVLVAAIREGYSPSTIVDGTSPCTVKFPGHLPYELSNSEGEGGEVEPLSSATAASLNCAYVRLASVVGLDNIEKAAHDLGITSDLRDHSLNDCDCLTPAMAIGGLYLGVSPLEMASAYATLADDGVYHKPFFIEKVLDRHGKVLFENKPKGEQRVSKQTARVAVSVLRGVVTGGTGTRANPGKWPTFGKTGTTQDYRDAWFVGSTKQLTAAVWMGSPIGRVPMTNVGSVGRVFGGTYPARIFGQFMKDAMKDQPAEAFTAYDPKQLGHKTMNITTTSSSSTSSTSIPGDGVIVGPDGSTSTTTKKPGSTTTTTVHDKPPFNPEDPNCKEPPDWYDKFGEYFCKQK